jgi:hypothetical protein
MTRANLKRLRAALVARVMMRARMALARLQAMMMKGVDDDDDDDDDGVREP